MKDESYSGGLGMLALRLVGGLLLAAHGAQKLFGWWDGPGLQGFAGAVENMGMKPGRLWAPAAGLAEFGGGLLTALGLLNPLGPLGAIAAMIVATRKAHWGKPVFAMKGGAELPLTNIALALAVAVEGPGRYSLDRFLGIRVPIWLRILAVSGTVAGLVAALNPERLPGAVQTWLRLKADEEASSPSPVG